MKSKRSVLLDLIRSLAIFLVVFAHIFQTIGNPAGGFFGIKNFYYVSLGGIGVTIFLILSGIVLELNYGDKNIKYRQFIWGRILRIYPIYLISLFVGFVYYLFLNNFTCADCTVFNIMASITGTHAFWGDWGGPFVATSWFIGLIISLYLLYPAISKFIKTKPHLAIATLFIISTLTRLVLGKYNILPERPLDWFVLSRIFEFSLGVYLAKSIKDNFWHTLDKYKNFGEVTKQLSRLSFPLFLIHYPLLSLIPIFYNKVGLNLSIIFYLIISIIVSWIIILINKQILDPSTFSKKAKN